MQQVEADPHCSAPTTSEPSSNCRWKPAGSNARGEAQGIGHLARGLGDVRSDGDRPVGQLVPRQQVAGERQPQGEDKQAQPRPAN